MWPGILPELGRVLTRKIGNSRQLLQNGVNMFSAGKTQRRLWSPLPGLQTVANSLHVMSWYSTVLLSEVARSTLLGFLGSCQVILSSLLRSSCLYDCTRDERWKHYTRPSRKWGSILSFCSFFNYVQSAILKFYRSPITSMSIKNIICHIVYT